MVGQPPENPAAGVPQASAPESRQELLKNAMNALKPYLAKGEVNASAQDPAKKGGAVLEQKKPDDSAAQTEHVQGEGTTQSEPDKDPQKGKGAEGTENNPDPEEERKKAEAEVEKLIRLGELQLPFADRDRLRILAEGGNINNAIRSLAQDMAQHPEMFAGHDASGNPVELSEEQKNARIALGYDLEEAVIIEDMYSAQLKKNRATQMGESSSIAEAEERILEANRRREEIINERKQKKLEHYENGVQAVLEAIGVTKSDVLESEEGRPLATLDRYIGKAIQNPAPRAALVAKMRASGRFSEEQINQFEQMVPEIFKAKSIKEKVRFAAKVGGGIGAFFILLAWMSSKSGQGPQGHM